MTLQFEASDRLGPFSYEVAFDASDEIVVLFGHSGAGKSLTLQYVAGIRTPKSGRIAINGHTVFDRERRVNVPPQRRGVGYVVQDLALFPNMTVAENIRFGMARGTDKARRLSELVTLMRLDGFEGRLPSEISGGQAQRVALARAIGRDASLLLLDEPFSALDESLRAVMRRELLRLRNELGLSVIFVTHDLREAHLLADRLAVFDQGKLLQFDGREEVFRRPSSRRVAELTGITNIFAGRVLGRDEARLIIDVQGFTVDAVAPPGSAFGVNAEVDVCIRPELANLRRVSIEESPELNLLPARIVEEFAYGSTHTLKMEPIGRGPALEVEIAARPYEVLGLQQRKEWTVELPAGDLHVMPRQL